MYNSFASFHLYPSPHSSILYMAVNALTIIYDHDTSWKLSRLYSAEIMCWWKRLFKSSSLPDESNQLNKVPCLKLDVFLWFVHDVSAELSFPHHRQVVQKYAYANHPEPIQYTDCTLGDDETVSYCKNFFGPLLFAVIIWYD